MPISLICVIIRVFSDYRGRRFFMEGRHAESVTVLNAKRHGWCRWPGAGRTRSSAPAPLGRRGYSVATLGCRIALVVHLLLDHGVVRHVLEHIVGEEELPVRR